MAGRRLITNAERSHMDDLRLRGLRTGRVYENRLMGLRTAEVRRVLELCRDYGDPDMWPGVVEGNLSESAYWESWLTGLITGVGIPMAETTARELREMKAFGDRGIWMKILSLFARKRAGENIVSVTGTLKESLLRILRGEMEDAPGLGIEKLTKRVVRKFRELTRWEVRRIAQTESMIGMAEAANEATKTLDIDFTKQWCVSGLSNTRDSHLEVDGVEVDGNEPFRLKGGLLMYPHDTSLGASAGEIINCACSCIRRPK